MAKKSKPAPVGDKVTKDEGAKPYDGTAAPVEAVDPLSPGSRHGLKLPTSDEDVYTHKARVYGIKGRLGDGPCAVTKKGPVMMPNGDIARPGNTFDPVVERMSPGRYESLLVRKYITAAPADIEAALLKGGK